MCNQAQEMLIVDPPADLVLEGPINRAVCKKFTVLNPSKQTRVAFKLKTTTPNLFFVRPNVGFVKPLEKVTIDIFVHPIGQEARTNRHKFLMQAAEASDDVHDLTKFWKNMHPSKVWEHRIKVKVLDPAAESAPKSMEGNVEREPGDPLANLLQQVNELEEEKQSMILTIEKLLEENKQLTLLYETRSKKQGRGLLYVIFAFVFAIMAVFYGLNYL